MDRIKGLLGLFIFLVMLVASTGTLISYVFGGDELIVIRGTSIPIACVLWPLVIGFGIILLIDKKRGAL